MKLDTVESWVRWCAAAGAGVGAGTIYVGLWRQARHAKGRTTGDLPAISRPFLKGPFSFYLAMSVPGLTLLRLAWRPIRPSLSRPPRIAALVLGSLLYFPGLALMLWGRLTMGKMHGISSSFGAQLYADHRLVTSGPFALVRHPMYLGGIMAELGGLLIYRTWATLLMVTNIPDLVRRSHVEERLLAAQFGEQWAEYSRRVPALIPRLRG